MNKNLIRLTEAQLHRVIKESVQKILNEVVSKDKNGNLVWNPKENSEYRIGKASSNGWNNLMKNGKETGYNIMGFREIPDEHGEYTGTREYDLWNNKMQNRTDFIDY